MDPRHVGRPGAGLMARQRRAMPNGCASHAGAVTEGVIDVYMIT